MMYGGVNDAVSKRPRMFPLLCDDQGVSKGGRTGPDGGGTHHCWTRV